MVLPALEGGFLHHEHEGGGFEAFLHPRNPDILPHLKSSERGGNFHVLIPSWTLGIPGSLEEHSQEWSIKDG